MADAQKFLAANLGTRPQNGHGQRNSSALHQGPLGFGGGTISTAWLERAGASAGQQHAAALALW
jgi:hypothetical protein